MRKLLARFNKDEKGATAIEYGLIAALMSVIVIAAIPLVGTGLKTTFTNIGTTLTNQSAPEAKITP